jgi:uncharacterized protein (DUF1501 family)
MHSSSFTSPVSRRGFVRSIGIAGAALAAAPLLRAGLNRAGARGGRSLVVIHLAGGHDARSTFVPCDDDAYYRARPTLALRRRDVLQLDESVWLNRAAADLAPIYERGEFALVPNVGFAPASLSHYRATQIWLSGSAPEEVRASSWTERCGLPPVDAGGDFEAALAQIAERIAKSGTGEIFRVRLEGFDTHFEQRAAHDAAIATFARGLARLQRRLAQRGVGEQVITVAFSEFGRALAENEFGGTHHGERGQCYLIGPAVRGGLPRAATKVDHRRVIATAIEGWLGLPAAPVLGGTVEPLRVLI